MPYSLDAVTSRVEGLGGGSGVRKGVGVGFADELQNLEPDHPGEPCMKGGKGDHGVVLAAPCRSTLLPLSSKPQTLSLHPKVLNPKLEFFTPEV